MKFEKLILSTWQENAAQWVETIEQTKIPSREFTNPALIDCINNHIQKSVLDIGCGEGWLGSSLMKEDFNVFGLDGTESLVKAAKQKSDTQNYALATFQEIVDWAFQKTPSRILDRIQNQQFKGSVFNFCLYEKDGVSDLLKSVVKLISKEGKIIIQTIHPRSMLAMGHPYKSQWVEDSWQGLKGNFKNGHPWYFRTLEDWIAVFESSGLLVEKMYEPMEKETDRPVSIIFVLTNTSNH
ncbi:Methyltransferase type 11 [Indibacter alkaliphilus LW1]|uniref:Methyltransferase type 11 n=1 Tax=Indibacter alkaliphilus (strain CCUG 57479 / KCTC 22604 / LW1) TaxID=1189612 RepID=S2D7X4_INDAL|nr:methyltransferase domain-containing protein [Indibacter alkaliphilus]EOZ95322.1 Methyltransferase type 11 [Indibacter alkaliphilus LW1]